MLRAVANVSFNECEVCGSSFWRTFGYSVLIFPEIFSSVVVVVDVDIIILAVNESAMKRTKWNAGKYFSFESSTTFLFLFVIWIAICFLLLPPDSMTMNCEWYTHPISGREMELYTFVYPIQIECTYICFIPFVASEFSDLFDSIISYLWLRAALDGHGLRLIFCRITSLNWICIWNTDMSFTLYCILFSENSCICTYTLVAVESIAFIFNFIIVNCNTLPTTINCCY